MSSTCFRHCTQISMKPESPAQPIDPLKPSPTLLIKLGSIIVHYQEMTSSAGHQYDKYALQTLEEDSEVREWLSQMSKMAFLPVKR